MLFHKSPKVPRALPSSQTKLTIKRLIDVSIALVGMLLLSPVMGFISVLIFIRMGSPILFRQERPGWNCKPFVLLKFRTMNEVHDEKGRLLDDDHRLTRLGRFLRRWSLDELPQLINVIKGELSLVGPRPLLMKYLDRYSPEQLRRHEVKPGITGWTQVKGRNALTWEEKFSFDVWYVDNWSLLLDAKIILLTIIAVLNGKGIGHQDQVTMPEFFETKGNTTQKET